MQAETAPLQVTTDQADAAADDDAPSWVLGGRYQVRERIGTGGMAEVFCATDLLLQRDVAVKVFRSVASTDEDSSGAGRQEIELRALAQLSHPHLITLFDASVTDQPPYLVMELVKGPNLAARIAQGPLPEAEVRAIGGQIADALAYVHSQGMVHRDVKPANILLGTDGISADGACRARLSDFGIVRLLGSERLTAADFTLGTASYLAPEQARGGDVTPAADVYSLGLVLIEALTGRRSFEGPAVEAVLARLSRDPEIPAGLPHPWAGLLAAMTARDPAMRPSPAAVARALRMNELPPAAVPSTNEGVLAAGGIAAGAVAADDQPTSVIPAPWAAPAAAVTPATLAPLSQLVASPRPPLAATVFDAAAEPATHAYVPANLVPAGPVPGSVVAGDVLVDPYLDDPYLDEPTHPRRWFALAALFAFVIVGAACFLAFGSTPSGSKNAPAGSNTVVSTPRHAAVTTHASAVVATVPQPVATHASTSAAAPKPSATAPKVVPHSAAAPASTAAVAPSVSSTPPPSTDAPTTSAAPTSSPSATQSTGTGAAYVAAPSPTPTG